MHDAVIKYVEANLPENPGAVLEFGSRNLNGSVRSIIDADRYVGVDLYEGPDVDVVGDAATVRVDGEFDLVVSTEVFEHADDENCRAIIGNAFAHLRYGGRFVATMAGVGRGPHSAIEAVPELQPGEFYRNVTADLLAGWLQDAGFRRFSIDIDGLDIRCTAWKE